MPSQIIDTGDYLFILTDTRLYNLRGNELHALIDVYGAGPLVVTNGLSSRLVDENKRTNGHHQEQGQSVGKQNGSGVHAKRCGRERIHVKSKDPIYGYR